MSLTKIPLSGSNCRIVSSPLIRSTSRRFLVAAWCLFVISNAGANIKTACGNAGQGWSNAANWLPAGVPQSGDTAVIPLGVTISVKGQIYSLPDPTITLKIFGTLDFDPSGKLDFSSSSAIGIYNSAHITTNGTSSEIITIGGITKYNGQVDGNLTGPKFANATTGTSPSGFAQGVLPIRLLSFSYKTMDRKVLLEWTLVQESSEDRYEIQRSNNAQNWQVIATVLPTGMADQTVSYSFLDAAATNEINFYMLNLVSIDGLNKYSRILAVDLYNSNSVVSIFPNPARSMATLKWNDAAEKPTVIKVLDNAGMEVKNLNVMNANFTSLDVNHFRDGVYHVLFFSNNQLQNSSSLVVRR